MFKIVNVIILAAGRGSRMLELCQNTPKPLLKLNNKPIIENIIEFFQNLGLQKIYVVTGYLAEQFDYLVEKYNVRLINNKIWNTTNNSSSILAAKQYLTDTLVINGDVVITQDCVGLSYDSSVTYCEINDNLNEWAVHIDNNNNIVEFDKKPINYKGLYQREITVLSNEMSQAIKQKLIHADLNEYYELLVLECAKQYKLDFKPYIIAPNAVYDIDNKDDFLSNLKF